MQHPLLYEINTRCWLSELTERAGSRLSLSDIPDAEFAFWQRCGFTHLWLMGVWTLGARGRAWSRKLLRKGKFRCDQIAGSPYAIAGYRVSRQLGGESALKKFRRKLNARGIKLLLDFVPNHTAIDHPWVKVHPEFYVTGDTPRAGTTKPYRDATRWFAYGHCGHGAPWADTLQLDYRNPQVRDAIIDELIAVSAKCDGVRCDMAMLALNDVFVQTWRAFPATHPLPALEFWREAIAAVRERHREFLFLAEVYWDFEARLQELGFDYTYDKPSYDRIIARDGANTATYLQRLTPRFLACSAHFIENHDEPRIASLLSFEEHRAAALLILALPGMRFLHEGQLSGAQIHAHVHLARRGSEPAQEQIAAFYEKLLQVLPQTCVGRGDWTLLAPWPAWTDNSTHKNFALVQWQADPNTFDLAAINLAGARSQCFAPLRIKELAGADWRFSDLLGEEVHDRNGAELAGRGLYLDLPPHGAQLFHCDRIQK